MSRLILSVALIGAMYGIAGAAETVTPANLGDLTARIKELTSRVEALEAENSELRQRLAALEAVSEGRDGNTAPMRTSDQPVMQLLSIETVGGDPRDSEQAAILDREANKLDESARQEDAAAAATGPRSSWTNQKEEERQDRLRADHRKKAAEFRSMANKKRSEAAKLRRQFEVTRQVIRGWDGKRQVQLETDRDLSAALTKIEPGGFLTWVGRRTGLSGNYDVFKVTAVTPATRPADFQEAGKPGR